MLSFSNVLSSIRRSQNVDCLSAVRSICVAGVLTFGLVFCSGCHRNAANDLYVQQLNAEARLLEDRIYEYDAAYRKLQLQKELLEENIFRLQHELAAAAATENGDSYDPYRKKSPSVPRVAPPLSLDPESIEALPNPAEAPPQGFGEVAPLPERVAPPEGAAEPVAPPTLPPIESPFDPPTDQDLAPPEIELGTSPQSIAPLPAPVPLTEHSEPSTSDSPVELASFQTINPLQSDSAAAVEIDAEAIDDVEDSEHELIVKLHPASTRFIDADGNGEADRLRVLVQPMTGSGRIIATDAAAVVVLIDPSATDPQDPALPKRLAMWRYDAAELAQRYDPVGSSAGYRFEEEIPQPIEGQQRLEVAVRWELADGRKLVDQHPVFAAAVSDPLRVWTAR